MWKGFLNVVHSKLRKFSLKLSDIFLSFKLISKLSKIKKSVILSVESPYYMWFEPLLKDGKNTILIDKDFNTPVFSTIIISKGFNIL